METIEGAKLQDAAGGAPAGEGGSRSTRSTRSTSGESVEELHQPVGVGLKSQRRRTFKVVAMEEVNSSSQGGISRSPTKGGDSIPTGGCPFHNMDWTTVVPGQNMLVVLSAVLAYLLIHQWTQRNRPGPKSWPLIGSLPLLLKNWPRFFDFLLEFFDQGHDYIWINLSFGFEGIYIAEPSLVEHVLKTNFANYPKGRLVTKHTQELLGNGIFNSDHEAWKVQRKVASFEFSSTVLRDFSHAVYKDNGVKLVRIISEFSESNRSMDLQDLFMRMTLDSTSKLGFGVDLGCLSASLPAVPFAAAFDRANELSFHRFIDLWWKLKRILKIGEEKELDNCLKVIDSFSYDVIRRRREEMNNPEALEKMAKPDLLSRFMSLRTGDNETFSDQALRDVLLNFIIAGRDTTGLTLSWFMYRLCLHPEVAQKILEEIQSLEKEEGSFTGGGESGDRYTKFAEVLTYKNLGKLHYLHAALSETLRLHPAVPVDGKTALNDDVLPNGITVKKGHMVTYCSYVMGRLERVWGPDAKEFRPERWLKDGIFQPESPFKFVTFHAGPRACLGKDSAYLQMKLTAALLVKFFTFQLVPGHEVEYRTMFVLTMRRGIKVTATPRRSSSFVPRHATLHRTAVGV
ncbi:unnamed protein product [Calypogeia fissa]